MAEAAESGVSIEASAAAPEASSEDTVTPMSERPTCVICLGMAGSGKTTFVQVKICLLTVINFVVCGSETHSSSPCTEEASLRREP